MTVADVIDPAQAAEDAEIVQAFLEESGDNLDQLDRDLVDLEARPDDAELLGRVFRTIHTIKGTCGFLGFERLQVLSHAGENLLDALRSGRLRLDAPITTSLLHLVDAIRTVLQCIATTGGEGDDDHGAVVADLAARLVSGRETLARAEADDQGPAATGDAVAIPVGPEAPGPDGTPRVPVDPPGGAAPADSGVRVDVALLDKLMNLVGELVQTRSQLRAVVPDDDSGPLAEPLRQLRLVTTELQQGIMKARLQSVGVLTTKFHRLARDLAGSLGKQVRLETAGDDVGVDRSIQEALRDPLVHLIRNAVDHGIETPVERVAAGKNPEGLLQITTSHRGDRVHIEISDDGRGIDRQRLAAAAVRAGILSSETAAGLGDPELLNLIFVPGLSTNDEINNISGRGVGMDVVRASLGTVGGAIEVTSPAGEGTVFGIDVPLTLAIMATVLVWSGGERYAIPQVYVREILHLDTASVAMSITEVEGARILRRDGGLMPLIELADRLGLPAVARVDGGVDVVVVDIGGRCSGIVVDEVGESNETVVKALTSATRAIPVFAGVTIMGDGRPSLILDLDGLTNTSGSTVGHGQPSVHAAVAPDLVDGASSLLLASSAGGGRLAIPVSAVRRLEQFSSEAVEPAGTIDVIGYQGSILPLLRVPELCGEAHDARPVAGGPVRILQTVVCNSSAGPVGLVVDNIDDVVTDQPGPWTTGRNTASRTVVAGRVTEMVDIEMLVAQAGLS